MLVFLCYRIASWISLLHKVVEGKKPSLPKRQFGNFPKFIQMETPTSENIVQVSTGVLECPLEKDGTLSLATLRSLLPGARGLWYKPSEFKPIQLMENQRNLCPPVKDGVIEYITSVFSKRTFATVWALVYPQSSVQKCTVAKKISTTAASLNPHQISSFHDLSEADLSSDSIPYDVYFRQKRCSDPAIECAEKSVRLVKQSQRLLELENEIAELKKLVNESNNTSSRTKQSERKASIQCCDSCKSICKNYQMLLDQKAQDIELLLEGYARNRRLIDELSKMGIGNQDELKEQKEKILQQMEYICKQCTEKFEFPDTDKSTTDKDDQIEVTVIPGSNAEQLGESEKKKRLESDIESNEKALFASEPVKWSGNIVNTWVMMENAEKLKSTDQEDVAKLRYRRSLSVERDEDPSRTDTTTTTNTTTAAMERKMVPDQFSAMITDTSAEDECNKWKAMCENLQDHLDKQNKQIAEFTRLMDWIEDESEMLQEGLRKLEKKMANSAETVGQLENQKTGDDADYNKSIDELKSDSKPTAEACNKLQNELNELKSKCKNLSQKLHNGNLNLEESAPLVDVDEFKKKYKEKKQRCIELESALEDKEAQLDRIKRENDKLQMDIQLIQQQFNEMNEPLANVEEESKMKLPDSTEVHEEEQFSVKQQPYEECFGENLDNPYEAKDAEYQLKRIGESETASSRRKWSEDKLNIIADLQNQLNDQRQQLRNLEEERSEINEQLNQAKARCEQLESERENVSQIEQLQKCIQNLEVENEKLKLQTIEQSQRKSSNAGAEIPSTTAKKEAVDELSSELYQTYQRKYTLEMELETAKQQAANASAELASQQQARRVEQDELLAWQKKVEDLKAAFAKVDKDRLDLQQMYDEKNSALATVEDELESVRRKLSALQGSSATLGEGENQDAAEEERRRLNEEIVTLQAQLSEASDKANWYAGEVGYFKQKLEEAYNEISRLEDQLKILQTAAAGQNLSSADANEVANLKEQLNRLNVELGTVRKELQKETDRANWYHGEVEYFRSMQKNIEEKLCNLIKKITNNSDANVNAEAALQQLNNVYECIQVDISTLMDKAKWYEGEKEYFKKEMEKFSEKCIELQDQNICNASQFEDAFIVNKEPYVDRQKWILSMLKLKKENMRRVQFEITAPHSHQVYLVGSFYNWECALLMNQRPNEKWELGLYVPVGRHEFRFIQNGQWCTDEQYATCPNDYGTLNNWLIVE
ncbi:hypothetical protein T11_8771 [Trichinella zimbabwensis]|uniref:5'-AMP-activated protein kinase subunit beta-1 n=1 Tax=Trichinella zimbabwensis TaxID=268475 RepID=A0A0V1HFI1_9BILA|nr:hypothetical protein T11_8771 [Trichinella zimbabwensis]